MPGADLAPVGSTGQGGLQLLNHGLHIGWAMVSGRLAGHHAAQAQNRLDLTPVQPNRGELDGNGSPASVTAP
ncbi:hypothetical protein GCM10018966_102890 [Streptomyces yanii]